jgi:hypothetical protein
MTESKTWNVQFLATTIRYQVRIKAPTYGEALAWAKANADEGDDVNVWQELERNHTLSRGASETADTRVGPGSAPEKGFNSPAPHHTLPRDKP